MNQTLHIEPTGIRTRDARYATLNDIIRDHDLATALQTLYIEQFTVKLFNIIRLSMFGYIIDLMRREEILTIRHM